MGFIATVVGSFIGIRQSALNFFLTHLPYSFHGAETSLKNLS